MPDVSPALRSLVRARANLHCEYCLIPDQIALIAHEVDHITAIKHGGQTISENLALCCALCNKHKGSDIASIDPDTGEVEPLFHPRRQRWLDHFELSGPEILPRTAVGRVTVRLLQLNRPERVKERELMIQAGLLEPPTAPGDLPKP
jgi:hypothetical protein